MLFIKKLFTNKYFVWTLWFILPFIAVLKEVNLHLINNYYIFKYTFFHLVHQQNLYALYPKLYDDCNHYGPFFSLIIAPFAILPDALGVILWSLFGAFVLLKAVLLLPITPQKQLGILLICVNELFTSTCYLQSNPLIAGLILLSYVFIKKEKDFWAALMIAIGTYIKLYGIVGLAFFFFSNHKLKFTLSMVFWFIVLFILPMLISSPHYIVQCYRDWYNSLSAKDVQNSTSDMQDISVKGIVRRVFNVQVSNIWFIIPGVFIFMSVYLRFKKFINVNFQLLIVASTLLFPVILSSSSESPTYIIAMVGVAVWFVNLDKPLARFEIFLLVFALLITSFATSFIFPPYINSHYIYKYAFKALPCVIVWLKIIYESWTRRFAPQQTPIAA